MIWLVVKHLGPLLAPRVGFSRIITSHNPIRASLVDGIAVDNYSANELTDETALAWIKSVEVTLTFAQVEATAVDLVRNHNGKAPVKAVDLVSLSPINGILGAWPTESDRGIIGLVKTAGWDLLDETTFPRLYPEYTAWRGSRTSGVVPTWDERREAVHAALARGDFCLSGWFVYDIAAFDEAVARFDPLVVREQSHN